MLKVTFVLDNVRSAFNVGSIFRTADGLDFDINLIGITPIPGKDKKLDKTSLSSLGFVNWRYFKNDKVWFDEISSNVESSRILIVSVEEGKFSKTVSLFDFAGQVSFKDFDFVYIILGHEINGVSDFLLQKSNFVMKIPMFGKKNSLNVATCAGIVGFRLKEIFI